MFPRDSAVDAVTFRTLQDELKSRTMIAFVGAGMSARVGFGNWSQLLQNLRAEADRNPAPDLPKDQPLSSGFDDNSILGSDMPWAADIIRKRFGDTQSYLEILREFFSRPLRSDAAVEAFARIPFAHVFTTNYDEVLETALRKASRPPEVRNWRAPDDSVKVMNSLLSPDPDRPELVYLHGKHDSPETIVLSESDYRAQYVKSDETTRKLFAIFALRKSVFFGFSFDDLDVTSVLRAVKASTGEQPNHFAILPAAHKEGPMTPAEREHKRNRLNQKFGIRPVFYESDGKDHSNFEKIVFALKDQASVRVPTRAKQTTVTNRKSLPTARRSSSRVAAKRERAPARVQKRGNAAPPQTWAQRPEFRKLRGQVDPDDPQKGRFGGQAIRNGRKLSATILADDPKGEWFQVVLTVAATKGKPPLKQKVDLWVHDSFPQEHYFTFANDLGIAKFSFRVWGSFTVGATCDNGMTPLELDLTEVKGPKGWPPD